MWLFLFLLFLAFQGYCDANDGTGALVGEIFVEENLVGVDSDFDWHTYYDMYPEVTQLTTPKLDRLFALKQYKKHGRKKGHIYPKRFPTMSSMEVFDQKLAAFIRHVHSSNVPLEDRSIVLYYIPSYSSSSFTGKEVLMNSLKLFMFAVSSDSSDESPNFYVLNVATDHDALSNPYLNLLPTQQNNVAVLHWQNNINEQLLNVRLVSLLHRANYLQSFHSLFFANMYTRGPFALQQQGQWLRQYKSLMLSSNSALVGTSISCELVRHVQNHTFLMRTDLVPAYLTAFNQSFSYKKWQSVTRMNMQYFSIIVTKSHAISSLLTQQPQDTTAHFDGKCLRSSSALLEYDSMFGNPISWCNTSISQVLFVPYHQHVAAALCPALKQQMPMRLLALRREMKIPFFLPETLQGGLLHDIALQYAEEELKGQLAMQHYREHFRPVRSVTSSPPLGQVCMLVRSSYIHSQERNVSLPDADFFSGFDNIAQSLLYQSDPNWIAYFFITDHYPFSTKLKAILASYNDTRLQFLHIPRAFRPKYTPRDAGYTATDAALRRILELPHCQWVSFTNADNIYGSEIVRRVRAAGSDPADIESNVLMNFDGTLLPHKIVLVPMDSRNFIYQDIAARWPMYHSSPPLHLPCHALDVSLKVNTLGVTVLPRPVVGKVDLAGAFFDKESLRREKIFFNNFSNPDIYPCTGCQDGYFTEHLVQHRHWTYATLGVDGLQSIVFHGPSPVYCLAAGHVFFGHVHVNKARCFTRATLSLLRHQDVDGDSGSRGLYNWEDFDRSEQYCLKLTHKGYEHFRKTENNK